MTENIDLQGVLVNLVQETVKATVIELKEQGIIETQPEPLSDNTVFNLKEAAEYMDCSEAFIRKLVRSGEIAGRKQGKWLAYKRSIDEWMENGGCI